MTPDPSVRHDRDFSIWVADLTDEQAKDLGVAFTNVLLAVVEHTDWVCGSRISDTEATNG